MPTKIEESMSPVEVEKFCALLASTKGGKKLRVIREIARKHGITISNDAAANFRDGPFAAHIKRLERGAQLAGVITKATAGDVDTLTAAQRVLQQDLLDALTDVDAEGKPDLDKASKIIGRLVLARNSDREAERLDRFDDSRIRIAEGRYQMAQLDVAKAALAYVKDLRAIAADTKTTDAEKLERARKRLFGDGPQVPTLAELSKDREGSKG